MPVPDRVAPLVAAYLQAVDAEAPGLVEGLYLTGSIALGEFRPGTSDIDFVAVMARAPAAAGLTALHRAHRQVRDRHPRPYFDGEYVTWTDLARDPRLAGDGPRSYAGRFFERSTDGCNPVTWHTLATCGVRCRGPEPASIDIWTNRAALASWTRSNLESYWRPLLRRTRRLGDPWSAIAFTSYGAVWIVLGVCRLHYTLATGTIASKEAAGRYALRAFPERWHRVLREELRIRAADRARPELASAVSELLNDLHIRRASGASLYATPLARRRDVVAFAEMAIADARRIECGGG